MSSFLGGVSLVANAKQRNVSEPQPQSRILARICSLELVLRGAVRLPTRTELQRSMTLSGAPCRGKDRSQPSQDPGLPCCSTEKTARHYGQRPTKRARRREEPTILCKFRGNLARLTMRKPKRMCRQGHSQPLVVPCLYQPTTEKACYNICRSGWDQHLPWGPVPLPACLVPMGFSFCKGPTASGRHAEPHLKENM